MCGIFQVKSASFHNFPSEQGLYVLELGGKESWLLNIFIIIIRRSIFVELLSCAKHSIISFNPCNNPVKQVLL